MIDLTITKPARIACACEACRVPCLHMPGYLVPADLSPLHEATGQGLSIKEWAEQHLLASPGAIVKQGDRMFRVGTLVPSRRKDKACHWLLDDGRCGVHSVSPFGCGYFRVCTDEPGSHELSREGLTEVMRDRDAKGPYSRLWDHLWKIGRRAATPEKCRERVQEALDRLH